MMTHVFEGNIPTHSALGVEYNCLTGRYSQHLVSGRVEWETHTSRQVEVELRQFSIKLGS